MFSRPRPRAWTITANRRWLTALLLCFSAAPAISAATYYVGPKGTGSLSTSPTAPGSLAFAVANAPAGSTVILEDGAYDGAPNGFDVVNSSVTFQAQHWHKASVINSTDTSLWDPDQKTKPTGDICQGIVFGPTPRNGWAGGGGEDWKFLDCEFVQNGGIGAGLHALFEHDLFSDAYSNAFDFAGSVTMKNCVERRANRISGDDDSVGNKEDYADNMVFDGLVSYDNNGSAIWFDTSNNDWVVKNSTFFGNHGGNNWLTLGISGGTSPTQFSGTGQDGEGLSVGMHIKAVGGTAANIGQATVITSASGSDPQTFTVSPALPATPVDGDQFIVQHGRTSNGDAFTTEANDSGVFTNNWVYCNTGDGFFDHASGGSKFGHKGGLVVTNNFFAYNGQDFNYTPDGRDDGSALVQFNQFKFLPGTSSAFASDGGSLGRFPGPMQIAFDHNIYDPDTASGSWAKWSPGNPAVVAGGLTADSQPSGQDYLQNPSTWNQDMNSIQAKVSFRSAPIAVYFWPTATDTDWKDVYTPNSTFGLSNSIHQIDDTDGAVNNTIDASLAGHKASDIITIPVVAHTPLDGTTCEVYDLNGRWVTLTVRLADQAAFLAAVPPYVTCIPGNKTKTYPIRVVLDTVGEYDIAADYTQTDGTAPTKPTMLAAIPGSTQSSLAWSPAPNALSYDVYRAASSSPQSSQRVATGVTATSYTDNGLKTGASYSYSIKAVNSYGASPASNSLAAKTHTVTSKITGSHALAKTTAYDLTALGQIDWVQWGDIGGINRKTTGGSQISDVTQIGGGKYGRWSSPQRNVSWTDSSPTIGNTGDQNYSWCNTVQNAGWTFTVPADTTARTLTILWGTGGGVGIKLTAHLSDGSAADYVDTQTLAATDYAMREETITYNAAKPGQMLTITLIKTDTTPGPSVDLMAAILR